MRVRTGLVLLLCLLACVGCNNGKSIDELIKDLLSGTEIDAVKAARTLPRGKGDAAKVVPALIEGLRIRATMSAAAPPSNLASFTN